MTAYFVGSVRLHCKRIVHICLCILCPFDSRLSVNISVSVRGLCISRSALFLLIENPFKSSMQYVLMCNVRIVGLVMETIYSVECSDAVANISNNALGWCFALLNFDGSNGY